METIAAIRDKRPILAVLFEGERSSWPALVCWLSGARTCGRTSGPYKAVLIPDEMYLTLIVFCAGDKRARALFCHTDEHVIRGAL
jgi:hypothetical protein